MLSYINNYYPVKTFTKEQFLKDYNRKYGDMDLGLNKRTKTLLVYMFANLMLIQNAFASNLAKIDQLGNTMLGTTRIIAYWIVIFVCLIEILKSVLKGDSKGIGKIIIQGLMAYGAMYYLPFLFDMVREVFAK